MLNSAWTIFRVSAAMRGNKILYWLGRVPLIRRLVPDSMYNAAEGKFALSAVLTVWRGLKALLSTFLYTALLCAAPLFIALPFPRGLDSAFGPFCWILLMLSGVAGPLLNASSVGANYLKYTCVRMMGMEARRFQLLAGAGHHLAKLAEFTPTLILAALLMGESVWAGVLLSGELAAARLVGEWIHVWAASKLKKPLYGRVWFTLLVIFGSLTAAYVPAFALMPDTHRWLLSVPALLLFLAAAVGSAVYLVRYPNYYRLILDTCTPERVSPEAARQKNAGAQFADVQLKDSDLTEEGASSRTGWPYLQELFFRRHSRMMYKPVKYILAGIGGVTAVGGALLLIFRGEETAEVFTRVTVCLPFCVFFLYIIQSNIIGTRICKAMFYNCDLAMLRFGWYREPGVVLKNFMLRFRRMCGVNLLLSGAVCVMFSVLTLCAGGRPAPGEYAAFLAALLCLAVFFSVHCLGMYYLFQPYTSDLQVKNPFFGIINWVMYMVCYMCIQIRSVPTWFTPVVLGVTVVYSGVILLAVVRRAPRTFRVK